MSGGTFDYWQHQIEYIVDDIKEAIQKSGKEVPERLWDYFMREHPKYRMCQTFEEETLRRFEEAIYVLKKAYIYLQRVDYLIACDDGEESFEERLVEELKALDEESRIGENGVRYIPIDRDVDPFADKE